MKNLNYGSSRLKANKENNQEIKLSPKVYKVNNKVDDARFEDSTLTKAKGWGTAMEVIKAISLKVAAAVGAAIEAASEVSTK